MGEQDLFLHFFVLAPAQFDTTMLEVFGTRSSFPTPPGQRVPAGTTTTQRIVPPLLLQDKTAPQRLKQPASYQGADPEGYVGCAEAPTAPKMAALGWQGIVTAILLGVA